MDIQGIVDQLNQQRVDFNRELDSIEKRNKRESIAFAIGAGVGFAAAYVGVTHLLNRNSEK